MRYSGPMKTEAAREALVRLLEIASEMLKDATILMQKTDGVEFLASMMEARNTYQKMVARAYETAMKIEAQGLAAGAVAASLLQG
jgi:phosphate uptake regulator